MVFGGGRMGAALLRGLLRAGREPASLAVVERDEARRGELASELPGVTIGDRPPPGESVVLAVKPADAEVACRAAVAGGARRLLSLMAGVTVATIEGWSGPQVHVLRAMPNTPALVGAGVSAVAAGTSADEADLRWATSVLGAVGEVVRVAEPDLDAVTGLSGSGPAYVFAVVEALIDGGVAAGLSAEVSRTLVLATLAGSARLLIETGASPEELRQQVTSPGGTTEAGLGALADHGLHSALVAAVAAATVRSRELGRRP